MKTFYAEPSFFVPAQEEDCGTRVGSAGVWDRSDHFFRLLIIAGVDTIVMSLPLWFQVMRHPRVSPGASNVLDGELHGIDCARRHIGLERSRRRDEPFRRIGIHHGTPHSFYRFVDDRKQFRLARVLQVFGFSDEEQPVRVSKSRSVNTWRPGRSYPTSHTNLVKMSAEPSTRRGLPTLSSSHITSTFLYWQYSNMANRRLSYGRAPDIGRLCLFLNPGRCKSLRFPQQW